MNATTASSPAKPFLSKKARRRALWLSVHKWIGILLLIPMAALGFTGSALVWPAKTELLVYPHRAPASAEADPAKITAQNLAAARVALADQGPVAALLIGEPGQPLMAGATPHKPPHMGLGPPTRMAAYIDPDSGKLLDLTESTGGFMWYMHATHGHLLLKGVGRPVVGVMGIILLVSAISGIYIWWPGRKRFWRALKWQKREGKALNLHKQTGIILSLILVAEAFTGVWISFPTFFAQIVEPGTEAGGHSHGRGPGGDVLPTQDADWPAMLARAQAAYDARPVSITAPTTERASWQLMLVGEKGPAEILIDPENGALDIDYRKDDATRATIVEHVMEGVHYGRVGGAVWAWIVFLSGVVMTFLSLTGIYIWAKRKLTHARR